MDVPQLKYELEVGKKSHLRVSAWNQFVYPDEWEEKKFRFKVINLPTKKKSPKSVISIMLLE